MLGFLRSAIHNPLRAIKLLAGSTVRLVWYELQTCGELPARSAQDGIQFRPLSEGELRDLEDGPFREGQLTRLEMFGESHAYGAYVEGRLAHVSWLLIGDVSRKDIPVVLKLRDDEAEITGCETLPAFRGKGLYPFAIGCLLRIAQQSGVNTVYMKTNESNLASQRGITKAGFRKAGTILLYYSPFLKNPFVFMRRDTRQMPTSACEPF
jgi:ribosomal protein S18 acetylase RimI-like enzyme